MLSTIGREVVASMGGGGLRMLLLHFSLKNAVFVPFPTFESRTERSIFCFDY